MSTDITPIDVAALIDARLTALGLTGPVDEPSVEPLAMPPHVATGELITSAWGNDVVDQLQAIETYHATYPKVAINGTGLAPSALQIISASWVGQLNAAGNATISFVQPFTAVPVVVAGMGMFSTGGMIVEVDAAVTTGSFNICVRYPDSGVVVPNISVRINYHAIGAG